MGNSGKVSAFGIEPAEQVMDLAAPAGNSNNAAIIALAIVSAVRIDKQGQLIVRFVNRFFHMDPPFFFVFSEPFVDY